MSDKKYVVSEGGWKAAAMAFDYDIVESRDECDKNLHKSLLAFIRWQSESGPVPNEKQAREAMGAVLPEFVQCAIRNWQRRMYLAPEPEAGCVHCGNSYKFVPDSPCACGHVHATYTGCGAEGCRCKKWHSECYSKAPEPFVPEEIKDLLDNLEVSRMGVSFESAKELGIEAFHRGKAQK
jgi:hypothetical protein